MRVREVYMHRRLGAGRVTLCAYLDPEAKTIDVGVALCSPADQFSRRIGRLISSGRRAKCPAFGVELTESAGSPTRQIEQCFYAWLLSEFGGPGLDDSWITAALPEVRRELRKVVQ